MVSLRGTRAPLHRDCRHRHLPPLHSALFPPPGTRCVSRLDALVVSAGRGRSLHAGTHTELFARGSRSCRRGVRALRLRRVVHRASHLPVLDLCPAALLCRAGESPRGIRAWTVAPALVWATVLLHGDGQTGYYFGFIALLWTVARAPGVQREACLRLLL